MLFASGRLVTGVRLHCPKPQWVRFSLIAHDPLPVPPSSLASRQYDRSLGLVISRRFYADGAVSRPKAHTGRTTRKVRAKKSATPKTATEKASTTKPKAKKKATSPKKATARSKSKSKSKPKPKSKGKRKVLTEAQKKKKAEQNAIKKLRELRKTALLKSPKVLPSTAWNVFLAERLSPLLKGSKESVTIITGQMKQMATAYKELSPEQTEHFNHVANQNKERNRAAYHTWITSHSPKEIQAANDARNRLSRHEGRRNSQKFPPLRDGRLVRRPPTVFGAFARDRYRTGDFKGIKNTEAIRLIAREWKVLPDHEKTPYKERFDKEFETWKQERKRVLSD